MNDRARQAREYLKQLDQLSESNGLSRMVRFTLEQVIEVETKKVSEEQKQRGKNSLYEMKLSEIIHSPETGLSDTFFTTIMRVPGGWIYRMVDKSHNLSSSVFVPFNNEFQKAQEEL